MQEEPKKKFNKIVSAQEQRDLFLIMEDPGWPVLEKIGRAIQDDWRDQMTIQDYRTTQDEHTVKDLIYRQGMIGGVKLFLSYVKQKKEKSEKYNKEVVAKQE